MNPSEAKHNEQKKRIRKWSQLVNYGEKKTERINFGLAVSQWHRYPKFVFTSGTDEMFIQKQ